MIKGKIEVTWAKTDYESLPWQENNNHMDKIISSVDTKPYNVGVFMCHEKDLLEKFYNAVSRFELEKKVIAVNKQCPGQVLPFHSDKYETYKKRNSVSEDDTVQRVIIFLHDPKPGHQLWIEDEICTGTAGSYFAWQDETRHMSANLGLEDRYILQLTGLVKK